MSDFNSSEIPNSSDCISRQAAIVVLDRYMEQLCSHINTPNDTESYSYARGLIIGITNGINALPSVQPEPCEDAVSRQAVLYLIADYDLSMGQVVNGIHTLPSVTPKAEQPEIIRCKDCKHLGKWENEVEYGYPSPCTRCKRRVEDHYER